MDRQKRIIERVKQTLVEEGYSEKKVTECSDSGFGDLSSFFEVMVDQRLEGKRELSAQEVFENMKMQINSLSATLRKGAEDYRKLENRHRALESDYFELIKESRRS